jgi:hypothetical protein
LLHEPGKVREDTIRAVLQAAGAIKGGLKPARPAVRIGILLLQRSRAFYRNLS